MKTTKLFSFLSLMLIFAVTVAYAEKGPDGSGDMASKSMIRYEVTIHDLNAGTLCNTYQVQITDETGRLVSSPVTFVPGINKYTFFEEAPAKGKLRIANLVFSNYADRYVCKVSFTLRPTVILWPFLGGQTYSLDLFPVIQSGSQEVAED